MREALLKADGETDRQRVRLPHPAHPPRQAIEARRRQAKG